MAKGVNCLSLREDGNPCGECQNCRDFEEGRLLDIIEIDAASNTGVDNIREMIERAQFQPTQARFKVYIIDEVHMLSKGAFNALLKTLEEPPKHVKFILATTEIHKIPDTIISRTQRYDFRRISAQDIVERLRFIAHAESIDAEESALELIARLSKGGLRDAITLLEQYSVGGILKRRYIEENLELFGDDFLVSFIDALLSSKSEKALSDIASVRDRGADTKLFLEQILFFLRDQLLKTLHSPEFGSYLRLFEAFETAYGRIKIVPDSFLLLETTVLKILHGDVAPIPRPTAPVASVSAPVSAPEKKAPVETPKKSEPKLVDIPAPIVPVMSVESNTPSSLESTDRKPINFSELIEHIRTIPRRGFVALSLRASSYRVENDTLTVFVENDFNFKKLDTAEIRESILEAVTTLFGSGYSLDIRKGVGGSRPPKSLADEAGEIF